MILLLLVLMPLLASLISLASKKNIEFLNIVAVIFSLSELAVSVVAVSTVARSGSLFYTSFLYLDPMGSVLLLILGVVGFLATCYSTGYLKAEVYKGIIGPSRVRQYFVLLHLFLLVMFFAIITTSPILMWVAIEATTLSTAFLISFYNKPEAMEAAWKYLIINSVGLLIGFFGTLLFLSPAMKGGLGELISWQDLVSGSLNFDPSVIKIAFIFVLIGYGTKVGLVPMHTWLPDAHSKAPAPISSLLSGVLLNVAFLAILRFKLAADLAVGSDFSRGLLIYFGLASIVVAAFIILIQKNYKRLLAYSSIEHMGISALGFGFGGAGAFAALLHLFYHSLAKSMLFLSAGNILLKYSSTKIKNIKGIATSLPATAVLFVIGFLAITGVPPFGTFMTEFLILSAGVYRYPVVIVIVLAALALAFAGFLKHTTALIFGEPDSAILSGEGEWRTVWPIIILAAILITTSLALPSGLRSLISIAVQMY